jgi:hypothetical protein
MRLIVIFNRLTMGIVSLFALFSILDYDDDKGAYALVPNILKVKISSPVDSQQVPTGSLQITGNSTDDAQTDCIVTVALNRKLPYQTALATGPGDNNDYSNWSFTFNSSYTTIQPGQNRIAARLTCPENATSIKGTHINVTGVQSSANLTQQQQTTNLPPSPSLSTTTAAPLIVPTVYEEKKIIRPFQYQYYAKHNTNI